MPAADARKKMNELVSTLLTFERRNSDSAIADMLVEKGITDKTKKKQAKKLIEKKQIAKCLACNASIN